MRILLRHILGVGDFNGGQHLDHLFFGFRLGKVLMHPKNLCNLAFNGEHRVEAGHRLLEDDRNLIAADFIHLIPGAILEIAPVKQDFAAVNITVPIQQFENTHG